MGDNLIDRLRTAYTAFAGKDDKDKNALPDLNELVKSSSTGITAGLGKFNPSALVSRKGMKIFERMMLDDQVKASMLFKKHACLSTGWSVNLPEGVEGNSEDDEPTMFVRHVLNNMNETLEDGLLGVLSGLDYGYAVSEKIWELADTPFGEKIVLRALKDKPPTTFTFDSDEFGNLEKIVQKDEDGGGEGKSIEPDKCVVFVNEKKFGNWYGHSDLEAAYRPWWQKQNYHQWMAMYCERLGVPAIFLTYNPQLYNKAQKDDLKKVVEGIQASTAGILPRPGNDLFKGEDVLDFHVIEASKQVKNVFEPAINMANTDIARAMLMPGLLGFTPDGDVGSYSRSKKHFDSFIIIVEYIRRCLERKVMHTQIIKHLVDYNYPDVQNYPEFKFHPITDDVRADIVEKWVEAVEKGVVIPQKSDEEHIRSSFKFPAIDDDDERKERAEEDKDEDKKDKKQAEDKEEKSTKEENKEGKERGVTPKQEEQGDTPKSPRFTSLVTGELASPFSDAPRTFMYFTQMGDALDELERNAVDRLVTEFIRSRDKLLADVEKGKVRVDNIKLPNLRGIRSGISELLRSAYRYGRDTISNEIQHMPGFATEFALTPVEALSWFKQWEEFFVTDVIAKDILAESKGILLTAIKNGELLPDTMAKLSRVYEPFVGNAKVLRGDQVITPYRLETIVRTNTTTAFNQGRLIEARRNKHLLQGLRYSAVLDSRTTPVCDELHGRIFTVDDPDLDALTPPNHYRCRSLLVPVTIVSDVKESDFITPAQKGRGKELAGKGFV